VCDEEECKANASSGMQFSKCSSETLVDGVWIATCEYIPISSAPVVSTACHTQTVSLLVLMAMLVISLFLYVN